MTAQLVGLSRSTVTRRALFRTKPAFISPPKGAPAYYGFVILDDVVVDGLFLRDILQQ